MWQDKALTVSLNFHTLTPKKEVHMHNTEALKGSKERKTEKKETLTGGESNFSQTDRYLFLNRQKI